MNSPDDELLELVGRALRATEPVPPHVIDGAKAAWTWRTIDQELAELVFDSAVETAGVRSEDTARQLTFRSPGVEIEVMVTDDASRRVVGQLVPPGDHAVRLVIDDTVREATTDHLGRFSFESVGIGPVKLVVLDGEGHPLVTTEWVVL